MEISEQNRALIRQFEQILKRGHYVKSSTLQKVYNEVFNVNMSATSCGTCLRQRMKKLIEALNRLEAEEARAKENNEIKEEEKEDAVEGEPSRTVKARKKTKPKAT